MSPIDPNAFAIVTSSNGAVEAVIDRARAVAMRCGLPFVSRKAWDGASAALVVETNGASLTLSDGRVVRSHPGMGLVRVRRLVKGEEHDPIVDLTEARAGDSVLDATFGFGQDALVMAYAAGESGRVIGFEQSPLLAGLAMAGASFWAKPGAEIMSRVEIRHGDSQAFMKGCPDGSFDVVLIDPMFRRPRMAAPDFAALRDLADEALLSAEHLAEARRVARRWVLVKDAWPGKELRRLGIEPLLSRRSAEIAFGRIGP